MTERRQGTQSRKAVKTIKVSEETHQITKRYSQSKKVSMSIILDLVMPRVIEHDIFDPDWADKLRTYTEKVNAASSDEGCSHRHLVDGKYRCIWTKYNGPPKSRTLSPSWEGALEACLGCKEAERSRKAIAENEGLRYDKRRYYNAALNAAREIIRLEAELKELRGVDDLVVHQVPIVS